MSPNIMRRRRNRIKAMYHIVFEFYATFFVEILLFTLSILSLTFRLCIFKQFLQRY